MPKRLGFGNWHEVSSVFEVAFEHYSFEIFLIDTIGTASGELRFIDFTVSSPILVGMAVRRGTVRESNRGQTALRGYGHNPEGTLGRTLQKEATREVTAAGDFIVQDGILGSDFRFNRFQME